MEVKIEQMKCGQCGCEKHKVYRKINGELLIECTVCLSISEVVISANPKIEIRNFSGLGTICVFPEDVDSETMVHIPDNENTENAEQRPLLDCPYDKAVRCTMEEPCKGCETWAKHIEFKKKCDKCGLQNSENCNTCEALREI